MGDRDEKYGQTFWSETHDSDKPVMFNLMSGTVGDGAVIEFEESLNKTSAKGTDYLRLRKVKVESSGDTSVGAANGPVSVTSDTTKLLELIYADTQKILEFVSPLVVPDNPARVDEVAEVPDEPVNMDDIPF
jgi:hypothetical protein